MFTVLLTLLWDLPIFITVLYLQLNMNAVAMLVMYFIQVLYYILCIFRCK